MAAREDRRSRALREWVGLLASAALWAAGAPALLAQPQYAVAVRGTTLAGELAVWRVDPDGTITLHWSRALPAGATRVHVDPFGRYVLFVVEEGSWNYRIELWRIQSNFTLTQAGVFHRDDWLLSPRFNSLSQDGAWFVTFMTAWPPSEEPYHIGVFRISQDLQIELVGQPVLLPTDSDLVDIDDIVISSQGGRTVLAATGGLGKLFRFHLNDQGDITWDGQVTQLKVGLANQAVRQDGRVVVGGSISPTAGAVSYAVSSSGEVTVLDTFDTPGNLIKTHYHPDRLSVIAGGSIRRIDLNLDGTFPQTFARLPPGSTTVLQATETFDGRLALFGNIDNNGTASTLRTYFTPPGGGLVYANELRIPGTWEDIEFIPPRTEEVLGDANADGVRDIGDVVTYINHFNDDPDVGGPTDPTINGPVPRARADANQDGTIDEDDLAWLINFLLEDQGQ
jgi:hypothetical protein